MAKSPTPKPNLAHPLPAEALLGTRHPAAPEAPSARTPPHSDTLVIARAPGGYVLFALDQDQRAEDYTAHDASALAPTPATLAAQVTAWATAQPPAEFPA